MSLAERIALVNEKIAAAARQAGREPSEVTLVAATKVQTSDTIRQAIAAGVTICGENRVQEMTAHLDDDAYAGAALHFIGHLQTNKVRQVVGRVELIESVGSEHLLEAIEAQAAKLELVQDILLEVNIGGEASKSGISPEELSALAAQAEKSVDIDGLLALAASAPALDAAAPALPPPVEGRPRIAVARDKAFCFYYADGLELLETLGAELAEFSPLADESLPEGACGLYLGGGYPELFAGALAANAPMREAVRAAVAGGLPTVAECGGFLYLNRLLSDGEGRDWPMAGALPGRAANTGKLGRFGYVTLTAKKDGLLGPAGTRLPAHEFHYWDSDAPGSGFRADKPQSSRGWDCAFHTPTLYAGFPHFHFWAAPSAARNFVAAARRYVQEASL